MEFKNRYINNVANSLKKIDDKIEKRKKLKEKKEKKKEKEILNNFTSFHKFKKFLIKQTIIKQNKPLILSYLASGLKQGNNLLTLITRYKETLNITDSEEKHIIGILDEIEHIIKTKGTNTTYILYQVGLLSENEYLIISNYNDLYIGLELVLKMNKQKNNFSWAITLFFFPSFIVLLGLLIFQPELKAFAYNALEPINSQSKTLIKIPAYLEDRTAYSIGLTLFITFYVFIMYSINMVKRFKPTKFFKFFRLAEKEFIVNTFSALINLRKSGKSYIQSYKILSETTKDILTRTFYLKIYEASKEGNNASLYLIGKEYNMNKFNLSYLKIGTVNNDLDTTIETIYDYNLEIYQKQIKRLVKFLPLIGEIIMTIILLKPLIDIIMVTTVGAMDFTL